MNRRRWSIALLVLGAALLSVSLGQYGFMYIRQQGLQQQAALVLPSVPADTFSLAAQPVRLTIPSIGLDDVVVRGTDYSDLLEAPGLLAGSPAPGEGGNSVIAAHRDTFFRHIADLHLGDLVVVHRGPASFDYRIDSRQIVWPTDTGVLAPTRDARLTLITCYPTYWVGPAPKRLVLTAELAAK